MITKYLAWPVLLPLALLLVALGAALPSSRGSWVLIPLHVLWAVAAARLLDGEKSLTGEPLRAQLNWVRLALWWLSALQYLAWLVLLLALPAAWLVRGGGLPAVLLGTALVSALLLGVRRRWLFAAYCWFEPNRQHTLLGLRRALLRTLWQQPGVEAHFWTRGFWVNLSMLTLGVVPLAWLVLPELAAVWPLPLLGYSLALAPALHLLMLERGVALLGATPAQLPTAVPSEPTTLELLDQSQLDARLHDAVRLGQLEGASGWLEKGADVNAEPSKHAADRRAPLVLAAGTGQLKLVRLLIAAGAEVNRVSCGLTPLLAATRDSWNGRFDVVTTLLTNGAQTKQLDSEGASALHGAARSRDPALVQALLDAGAALDLVDAAGYTPLARASEEGNSVIVHALLSAGARCEFPGSLPAVVAAACAADDSPVVIHMLLGRCSINAQDAQGLSALQHAAVHDHAAIAEALLERGADANAQDLQGRSASMLAAQAGSARVLRRLVIASANPYLLDQQGRTALHYACSSEGIALEVLELLLTLGCPLERRDLQGRTARELALAGGSWELARRLSPDQELPQELNNALEDQGDLSLDRGSLLLRACRHARWPVAQTLLALGPLPQATLVEAVRTLDERLTPEWLKALRAAGLALGKAERDSVLALLARQIPAPFSALELLVSAGACLQCDAEGDSALLLLCGAAASLEGLEAPLGEAPPLALIQAILRGGAPLHARDSEGRDALSYALEWCPLEIISALLEAGANANSEDNEGRTPLLRALERSDLALPGLLQSLLRAGADPNRSARDGRSARGVAISRGAFELAQLLAWPAASHPGRALSPGDLPVAATLSDRSAVQKLLSLGISPDACDQDGTTALMHAAGRGDNALLDLLLEAGADLHASNRDGATALSAAILAGELGMVRRLVALGMSLENARGELGALGLAAGLQNQEMVQVLLELGADPNGGAATLPPVHAALRAGLLQVDVALAKQTLATLVDAGADPDRADPQARAALLVLVGAGQAVLKSPHDDRHLALIRELLRLGANVQIRDAQQRGVLHWCCKHALFDAASMLLDAGADPSMVDDFRKLPIDLASALNRHDFAALFRG